MADFELAVSKTIKNEGGGQYTETPDDRGGATKYGISAKFIKTMMKGNLTDEQCVNKIKTLTLLEAKRLYKEYFWNANRYGEIEDQSIADKVFDMSVLMGAPQANKILQKSISYFGNNSNLEVDGIIGNETINSINSKYEYSEEWSFSFFQELFVKYFVTICNKDKTQSQFLLGWLNRVMS